MGKILGSLKSFIPLNLRIRFRLGAREELERARQWLLRRPLPPPTLIQTVSNDPHARFFTRSGKAHAQPIRDAVRRHSLRPRRVLDFGCGIGRILRHLTPSEEFGSAEFHGCDYNPELVEWCRENLKPACFAVNAFAPPLPYEDGAFDFIYSYSVFTHLAKELQQDWVGELRRVLGPSGHLYVTVHGEYYLRSLTDAGREEFGRGRLVVVEESRSGSNTCAAFHPERYVREELAEGFEVVEFGPEGSGGHQDYYLLRKL